MDDRKYAHHDCFLKARNLLYFCSTTKYKCGFGSSYTAVFSSYFICALKDFNYSSSKPMLSRWHLAITKICRSPSAVLDSITLWYKSQPYVTYPVVRYLKSFGNFESYLSDTGRNPFILGQIYWVSYYFDYQRFLYVNNDVKGVVSK
jgi:hypothetical protein